MARRCCLVAPRGLDAMPHGGLDAARPVTGALIPPNPKLDHGSGPGNDRLLSHPHYGPKGNNND